MVRICIEAGLRSLSRHVGRVKTFLYHLVFLALFSAQAAFAAPQSLEEMAALCEEVASELAVQVCAGEVKCSIPEMKSFVVGTLGCDSIEHPVSWNGTCSEDTEPCGDEGDVPGPAARKGGRASPLEVIIGVLRVRKSPVLMLSGQTARNFAERKGRGRTSAVERGRNV